MRRGARPDVRTYADFRGFLRDAFAAAKRRDPRFSYGVLARRAGVAWRGHFKQVVDGRRKLTRAMAAKYAKGLGLSPEEAGFFALLADVSQAATDAERRAAEEAIRRWRWDRVVRRITSEEYGELCSRWPRPLILSLSLRKGFVADPAWISRTLLGLVSKESAKEALEFLVSKGYLRLRGRRLVETSGGKLEVVAESPERTPPWLDGFQADHHRLAIEAPSSPLLRYFTSANVILTRKEAEDLRVRFYRWWRSNLPVSSRVKAGALYIAQWDLFPVSRSSSELPSKR